MQPTLILLADSVYEAALMLTWGIVAIVTAGYVMTASSRSATAERATWRASVGSILLLCLMELLGVNSAVVGLIPLVDLEPHELHLAASDSRVETFESGVARTSSAFSERPWEESLAFEVSTEAAAQGVDESPPDQEAPIQESTDAPLRSPLGLAASAAAQRSAPAYSISDSRAAIDPWVEAEIEQADEMKVIERADANRPLDRPPSALVSQSDVPAMRPASSEPSRWPSAVAQSAPNLLAAVWIFGVVFCVVRNVRQQAQLFAARQVMKPVEDAVVLARVQCIAGQLGLRRPVQVMREADLTAPIVFGLLRPTLVLPSRFHHEFSGEQQDAILAHELAHVAGWDCGWQLLSDLACALVWWHPLVWYARRRLRLATELSADEATLAVPEGPERLAHCLVQLGRQLSGHPRYGWLGMAGTDFRSSLGRRVQRLLELSRRVPSSRSNRRHAWVSTGLLLLMLLTSIVSSTWARTRDQTEEKGSAMSVLTQSWRRSLAVTMVAALLGPASTSAIAAGPTDGEEDEKKVDVEIELVQSDDLDEERPTIRRYTTEAPSDVGRVERGKFRFVPNSADVVIEGDEVRRVERTERPDGGRDGRLRERVEVRERRSDDLAGDRDGPESVPGIRWRTRISQLGSEARKQQRAVVQESVRGIRAQLEELQGRESKEAHRIRVSLQTEIKELQRHLAELQKQSSANPEDRRVQHLEAAAANLHAAGLHEQAEYLEREARRIASSEAKENEPRDVLVPRRIRRGEERLGADFTRPLALRPTRELLPPMAGADEVARLRNEVESVRDEMHEMRAMLERLLKRRDAHEEERLLERRDAHEEERLLERRDAHEEEEVEIEYRERDHDDETRHGEHDEEDHEDEEDD